VLWAIGFLGLMVLFADPLEWKYTSIQVKKRLIAFFPNNAQERVIWIAVSFSIALSEEIVYRAVLFGLFYRLLGTYWTAGIDSAAFFAFAHRSYGRISVGSTFVVGLVLQWFVRISGGLYISIAVHFIHNYLALIYAIRGEPVQNPDAALAEIEIKSHVNHHASK
jgi:membrane protease YdiL (CAAX protease family)